MGCKRANHKSALVFFSLKIWGSWPDPGGTSFFPRLSHTDACVVDERSMLSRKGQGRVRGRVLLLLKLHRDIVPCTPGDAFPSEKLSSLQWHWPSQRVPWVALRDDGVMLLICGPSTIGSTHSMPSGRDELDAVQYAVESQGLSRRCEVLGVGARTGAGGPFRATKMRRLQALPTPGVQGHDGGSLSIGRPAHASAW